MLIFGLVMLGLAATLLGVTTLRRSREHRKRRLRQTGHCVWCEYDLSHTCTGVCPECGCPFQSPRRRTPRRTMVRLLNP
jgi:hypothetical protein